MLITGDIIYLCVTWRKCLTRAQWHNSNSKPGALVNERVVKQLVMEPVRRK